MLFVVAAEKMGPWTNSVDRYIFPAMRFRVTWNCSGIWKFKILFVSVWIYTAPCFFGVENVPGTIRITENHLVVAIFGSAIDRSKDIRGAFLINRWLP